MDKLKNKIKQIEDTKAQITRGDRLVASIKTTLVCSVTTNASRADFTDEDAEMIADLIERITADKRMNLKPIEDKINAIDSLFD